MKFAKNKKYKEGSDVPHEYFKYAIHLNAAGAKKVSDKFRHLTPEVNDWCNNNYGPCIPTDNNKGWNWCAWTIPPDPDSIIIYVHFEEDAMAFKIAWS